MSHKNKLDIVDAYPLSKLQNGMYFHYNSEVEEVLYHDVFSLRIRTCWDEQKFRQAIAALLSDHPVLRTSFEFTRFSQPMQLVHRTGEVRFSYLDPELSDEEELRLFIKRKMAALEQQPFDLQQKTQIRFTVIKLDDSQFQLLVDAHHMIFDGWSMATSLTALFRYYLSNMGYLGAFDVTRYDTSFKDFVKSEIKELESGESSQFWKDYLKNHLYQPLTMNEPRQEYGVKALKISITPYIHHLNELAHSEKVSLKDILLAVHLRVCGFIQGKAYGSSAVVANGRLEVPGSDELVGLFVNMLPLCLPLKSQSWSELISAVRQEQQKVMRYRRFPFPEMVREHGTPICDISFNYVHFHVYEKIQGLDFFQVLDGEVSEKSNFVLATTFHKGISDTLDLMLQYDTSIISDQDAQRFVRYYQNALVQLTEDVKADILIQSLLSYEELAQLENFSCPSMVQTSGNERVHRLFEAKAAQCGENVALVFEQREMTYRQLEEASNSLAHYLRKKGVGAGSTVGICLERSPEMIIAVLAVMKAGAGYVPMDNTHPAQRLAYIAHDSRMTYLLRDVMSPSFAIADDIVVMDINDICAEQEMTPSPPPLPLGVDANSVCYVVYTSGSTGTPKGVSMPHRVLTNMINAMPLQCSRLGEPLSMLQFSSFGFDMCFTDIFMTLFSGGCMRLIDRDMQRNLPELCQLISNENIERLYLPYAVVQLFAVTCQQHSFSLPSLKVVISTAEQLRITPEIRQFFIDHPDCQLVNQYGPSETNVVTGMQIEGAVSEWPDVPSIGRFLDNVQGLVLDQNQQLVPVGVVGELFIKEFAIADGYLNRPDLTAERFIKDPFNDAGNTRLYRTGDYVRYLPDGNLTYIGRIDEQIKIRGLRIELGEIEHILAKQDRVIGSAVIVRENKSGERQLIAYVVAKEQLQDMDIAEWVEAVKQELRLELPNYMVPEHFVLMSALPLTVNGKVDRKALLALSGPDTQQVYLAPETGLERAVADIWSQVLRVPVEDIGQYSNFFELGGHSMLVTQVVSLVRHKLSQEVSMRALFDAPTVKSFALRIEQADSAALMQNVIVAQVENEIEYEEGEM
ncbi:MAG: amino acid adenylation domain-containing protein [Gammaproteobacteria bacterium]|nr:amino acid adenylation domain-containing protein [Gammaproteobacteria bacterium]MBU2056893.1 amino acid adenylation domain-containing protein [Gammaproteobacteria bacterium]MBU2174575.1 amino acid adenylation domain-containing protein [Gammaproteobacteria bacterium]MBU2248267.1 amino acid adenylation domain-containing protein [Gammaproteobacteria bacterium]MBU2343728.1 amino acid adenylation domain-containing protein [Gammaproteobacteria bacterium]